MSKKLYHKQAFSNAVMALLSGAMLFLAFPRPGLYPLAWVALIPLLAAIRRASPVGSFFLGLLTGFAFFASLLYWITLFGYLPWLLLALFQAIFIAIFALFGNLAYRWERIALIFIPILWTGLEWARSLGLFGFTWGGLAVSQVKWLTIIQIASVTGPWGITFLIVLVNAALAGLLINRDKWSKLYAVTATALVIAAIISGSVSINRLDHDVQPDTKVAVIQGGIEMTWRNPEVLDDIYNTYWPITENLEGKPDLIVWPESALPGDLLSSDLLLSDVKRLADKHNSHMLVGGPNIILDEDSPAGYQELNGAYLVNPDNRNIESYFKVHLVPFGEFVPGREWLPFLDRYKVREVDYTSGKGYNTLPFPRGDLGAVICFESIFPYISRELVSKGAEALVVITNDSWFKQTAALPQHHDFSVLRAVENRRYVIRSATTGISSIIAPTGEVMSRSEVGEKTVVREKIAMQNDQTVYSRFGDWFGSLCAGLGIGGSVTLLVVKRKSKGHPRQVG